MCQRVQLHLRRNSLFVVAVPARLRKADVRINPAHPVHSPAAPAHNLSLRVRVLQPLRRVRKHLFARCPQAAIADRFRAQVPEIINVPAVPVPVNPFVPSSPDKVKVPLVRHILRGLPDRVVPADPAGRLALLGNDPAQFQQARALALACPAVPRCCRRFLIGFQEKPSPASQFMRENRHNASVPAPIGARWKASASCIPRGNAPAQVAA